MLGNRTVQGGTVLLLIALVIGLCLSGIQANSPTADEQNHVSRGYHYLVTGNLDLNIAPPFVNALSGIPLLWYRGIALPSYDATHYKTYINQFAEEFVWVYNDADQVINGGRLAIVFLSVVLAYHVYRWARELWGVSAGLLALFLYVLDPNILAHSQLVTTDLGLACFIFICMYRLWRFLMYRGRADLLTSGVALGLALATKLSAPLLIPIILLTLLIEARVPENLDLAGAWVWGRRIARKKWLSGLYFVGVVFALLGVFAFLSLWASYRFESAPLTSPGNHATVDRWISFAPARQLAYAIVENIRVPFPTYFKGVGWLQRYAQKGAPAFLMGQHSTRGWWYYFLVALAIKTPLPCLALVMLASLVSLSGDGLPRRRDYVLLVPVVVFLTASLFSFLSIGYRHILPVLPFLFVFASKVVLWLERRWLQVVLVVLGLWYALGTAGIHPHYLSYFNEIVGGPENGYRYLVDSNLDWGQDLKNVKSYMLQNDLQEIYLGYFGSAHPGYYGVRYLPLPMKEPEDLDLRAPAVYAISATYLQNGYLGDTEAFSWLRGYQPFSTIGYSILLYRLP
jgi:hypothetical protein